MRIETGKLHLNKFVDDADDFGCFHLTKIVASVMRCDYDDALKLMADGHVTVENVKMYRPCALWLAGRTLRVKMKEEKFDQSWKIEVTG